MNDSILETIKKMLGGNMQSDDTSFDSEILVFINTAISILEDIGLKSTEGFVVTGRDERWDDIAFDDNTIGSVKTFIFLFVKLMFDPPGSSSALDAMKRSYDELLWRIYSKFNYGSESELHKNHPHIEIVNGKPILIIDEKDADNYCINLKNVNNKPILFYEEREGF